MMLRVNGQYLDFNGDIEIEKKIKLFEDIETTDGDVSFAFDIELTSNNIRILNKPFPDSSSKTVYTIQDTEALNDEGMLINRGYIRIERITGRIASCSFWGGNNNWFGALTGNMTELNLSTYDIDITQANIIASWGNESGIIFPLMDTGGLVTRPYISTLIEDFLGCMFLHTMMKETFKQSGLKLAGELIEDPFYKSIIVATNTRSQTSIEDRSSYIGKTVTQTTIGDDNFFLLTFDDESTNPYFDGSQNNYNTVTSRYTADVKMAINVEINIETDIDGSTSGAIIIYLNGSHVFPGIFVDVFGGDFGQTFTFNTTLNLDAGDYFEVFTGETVGNTFNITGGHLRVTPIFLYKSFGVTCVPLWTKQQFVSNVLKIFNTIVSYDEYTKTVTINLFEKLKYKDSIDISEFIESSETDYCEFISNFGKNNNFKYSDGDDEDLRKYNISSFVKYGAGVIHADNDFLEESVDVIDSDFSTPISYVNTPYNSSFERIPFTEFIEDNERDITSVTNNAGVAEFHILDADDYFEAGDLVRIKTTYDGYNGDFRVTTVTSSYIRVLIMAFEEDATGTVVKLTHKVTTDDSVYLMSVTKNIPVNTFSDGGGFFLETSVQSTAVLAFFNLIKLGHEFELDYKQGLSFDRTEGITSFQRTIIEKYWTQFDRVINDPSMQVVIATLPWKIYNSITFLEPISIRTIDSSNRYYCNRMTGYKNSYTPCEIELIKLP